MTDSSLTFREIPNDSTLLIAAESQGMRVANLTRMPLGGRWAVRFLRQVTDDDVRLVLAEIDERDAV